MFYSQIILSRKGPLGKIWLAAHFEKKLSRQQIFSTDISATVDSVVNSNVPLALRVSGQLMLGIVRIYAKKLSYLVGDATEALYRMQLAYPSAESGGGALDLAEGGVGGVGGGNALVNVDDLRHFGQLPSQWPEDGEGEGEGERWGWAFTATLHQAHPLRHTSPSPLQLKALPSPSSSSRSRAGEVEVRRGGVAPGMVNIGGRPSPSPLPRASLLAPPPPPSDLPAFEEADLWGGMGAVGDYSLSTQLSPGLPLPDLSHVDPHPPTAFSTHSEGFIDQGGDAGGEEVREPRVAKRARGGGAVRGGPIELSERVVRQRFEDSGCILRKMGQGLLMGGREENGDLSLLEASDVRVGGLERRLGTLSAYSGVCEELRATLRLIEQRLPPPFFPPILAMTTSSFPAQSIPSPYSVEVARGGIEGVELSPRRSGLFSSSFGAAEEAEVSILQHNSYGDSHHAHDIDFLPPPVSMEYYDAPSSPSITLQKIQQTQAKAFSVLAKGKTRRTAASLFQELLVLQCEGRVGLSQPAPYGDILIEAF